MRSFFQHLWGDYSDGLSPDVGVQRHGEEVGLIHLSSVPYLGYTIRILLRPTVP